MTSVIASTVETLCQILADVLGVDLVRPEDGFFEVGGDSVLAVQVVARARAAGLTFSVRDLFDHQTAETLAAVIDSRSAESAESAESRESATAENAAQSPLLTFDDDEFGELDDLGEFEADEATQWSGDTEAEWET